MAGKSKTLPLLLLLLVLALAFAGWSALHNQADTPRVALGDVPIAVPGVSKTVEKTTIAELPEAPESTPDPTPSVSTPSAVERVTVATAAELELADAIWVSGRMVWPEGTPIGEQVEITAHGKAFPTRELYRARVEPNGNFRVAFAPNTRSGKLTVEAPHLFLPTPELLKLKDGRPTTEVLLEPLLGGRVIGQLQLPVADPALAAQLVGKPASSYGWSDLLHFASTRSAEVEADLRFELRGLDPRLEHQVSFDSEVAEELTVENLRLLPGEDLRLDLPLQLGVRLRGRVHFGSDSRPENLRLLCVSIVAPQAGGQARSGEESQQEQTHYDHGSIAEDGSFDLRGVKAGKVTLEAGSAQRIPAKLELGMLGSGEVREGLALTLGLGGRIAGSIRWPDGTAAVGADIELVDVGEPQAGSENFELMGEGGSGRVLTDAEGKFEVHGLQAGPFKVLASAKPREAGAKSKARAPTWKVQAEGVAIGTIDLELVLEAGYSVSGVVVDDTGAPIERFRVSATPQDESEQSDSKRVSSAFKSKDGGFELGGLLEGPHELELTLASYEAPQPIRIQVPADSGPFRFVATRRASVAGLVILPDGSAAARALVEVHSELRQSWDQVATRSNTKGEFRAKAVGAGSVSLRAQLQGFASSEFYPLQVAPGQAIENVRLVLRRSARITGEVRASFEGETLSGRQVAGVSAEGASTFDGSTDDKGRFAIENVDPGEYTITLAPSPEEMQRLLRPGEGSEADWELTQALQRSATVRVEEGGEAHVVFAAKERAGIRIRGGVRRGDEPVAFLRVRAVPADATDGREAQHALSDAQGRFELAVVHAGSYRVEALPSGPEGLPVGVKVEVPAAGLDGVDVRIPDGRIAGTLHASIPAAGGWMQVELESATGEKAMAWAEGDWPNAVFAFENLPAGQYTLVATAWINDGAGPPIGTLNPVRQMITLGEAQQVDDVAIEITGN